MGEEPEADFSAGPRSANDAAVGGGAAGGASRPRPGGSGGKPGGRQDGGQQGRKQTAGEGIGGARGLKRRKPDAGRDRSAAKERKEKEVLVPSRPF